MQTVTVNTITDEQIRELRDQARRNYAAHGLHVSLIAAHIAQDALAPGYPGRAKARARCAEILNQRARSK